MGRYSHKGYEKATTVFGRQWRVIECRRLEPAADLSGAITAAIERLASEGWQAEAEPRFGFVFIRRERERRLLMLTPRDPYETGPQSFNPYCSSPPLPRT